MTNAYKTKILCAQAWQIPKGGNICPPSWVFDCPNIGNVIISNDDTAVKLHIGQEEWRRNEGAVRIGNILEWYGPQNFKRKFESADTSEVRAYVG